MRSSDVRLGSTPSSISFARNAGSYCSSPRPRSHAAMSTLAFPTRSMPRSHRTPNCRGARILDGAVAAGIMRAQVCVTERLSTRARHPERSDDADNVTLPRGNMTFTGKTGPRVRGAKKCGGALGNCAIFRISLTALWCAANSETQMASTRCSSTLRAAGCGCETDRQQLGRLEKLLRVVG
jgi:hypothetical protein